MKRKYLTQSEVAGMMESALSVRSGVRDRCMIMFCFHHGFRISELLCLRISDIVITEGYITVHRLKNGFSTVHPLLPEEQAALQAWLAERSAWKGAQDCDAVFLSRRGVVYVTAAGIPYHPALWRAGGSGCDDTPAHAAARLRVCAGGPGVDTRLIQDYPGAP